MRVKPIHDVNPRNHLGFSKVDIIGLQSSPGNRHWSSGRCSRTARGPRRSARPYVSSTARSARVQWRIRQAFTTLPGWVPKRQGDQGHELGHAHSHRGRRRPSPSGRGRPRRRITATTGIITGATMVETTGATTAAPTAADRRARVIPDRKAAPARVRLGAVHGRVRPWRPAPADTAAARANAAVLRSLQVPADTAAGPARKAARPWRRALAATADAGLRAARPQAPGSGGYRGGGDRGGAGRLSRRRGLRPRRQSRRGRPLVQLSRRHASGVPRRAVQAFPRGYAYHRYSPRGATCPSCSSARTTI